MSDTLPFVVFISLERKDDPCKTGGESRSLFFTPVEKKCDTWPLLMFILLERKDDPCKTGGDNRSSILPLLRNESHFTSLSVSFIREEGRLLLNGGKKQVIDFSDNFTEVAGRSIGMPELTELTELTILQGSRVEPPRRQNWPIWPNWLFYRGPG